MTKRELVDKETLNDTLKEYREFAFKDDMIKLAIAFVLGGAFQKVVTSISDCLIMPLVNYLVLQTGSGWREHSFEPAEGVKFETGKMIGATIDFLLISVLLFVIWKIMKAALNKDKSKSNIFDQLKNFVLSNWFYPLTLTLSLGVSFFAGWIAGIWTLMTCSMVAVWAQNRQWRVERHKREELQKEKEELEKSLGVTNETRQSERTKANRSNS